MHSNKSVFRDLPAKKKVRDRVTLTQFWAGESPNDIFDMILSNMS